MPHCSDALPEIYAHNFWGKDLTFRVVAGARSPRHLPPLRPPKNLRSPLGSVSSCCWQGGVCSHVVEKGRPRSIISLTDTQNCQVGIERVVAHQWPAVVAQSDRQSLWGPQPVSLYWTYTELK